MVCYNCGKVNKDGVAFCPYCGADQTKAFAAMQNNAVDAWSATDAQSGDAAPKKKKNGLIVSIVAALAVVAVAALGFFFLPKWKEKTAADPADPPKKQEQAADNGNTTVVTEPEFQPDKGQTPLYEKVSLEKVDMTKQVATPGAKAEGMAWDGTEFYWLEDCDAASDEDGNIAKCHVARTLLNDKNSKERIQCEIYSDPGSGDIYKIVTIQSVENGLELTDYYYKSARPNLIYLRKDGVYAPAAATMDREGECYYFNDDVMVRWRLIQQSGQFGEYTLNPENVWYSQSNYFTEGEELRRIYDEKEAQMLNRAENIWNAVTTDGCKGRISGSVKDEAGDPVADATVSIYRKADGVLLYQKQTGDEGKFSCNVYLDDTECVMIIDAGSSVYKPLTVNGLTLCEDSATYHFGDLILHKAGEDTYPVQIKICDASVSQTEEDGNFTEGYVAGATVNFRAGSSAREGNIILTAEAGSGGEIEVNLPSGVYTAEIVGQGYATTYLDVEVSEGENSLKAWTLPVPSKGQCAVVLTWQGKKTDLDLTVFTPFRSIGDDMACVSARNPSDGHGNRLLADNKTDVEVAYLNTDDAGIFKIYVSDHTDCMEGKYDADKLGKRKARIYIYSADGYVADYACPAGENGVVWEAVEIRGATALPAGRLYTDVSGRKCWTGEKLPDTRERLLQTLENRDSNLSRLLSDLYYLNICLVNLNEEDPLVAMNRICNCEKDAVLYFLGFEVGGACHVPPVEKYFTEMPDLYYSYAMTRPNLEYAVYSMTGACPDFRYLYEDTRYGDGTGVGFALGLSAVDNISFKGISVERAGDLWRIDMDLVYEAAGDYCSGPPLCFDYGRTSILVRNAPDSCYDGYTLVSVESLDLQDNGWARDYARYIENSSEVLAFLQNDPWRRFSCKASLVYVDEDDVPELYILGDSFSMGSMILTWRDGVVSSCTSWNPCTYIPKTGYIMDDGFHTGAFWNRIYKVENGGVTLVANGEGNEVWDEKTKTYKEDANGETFKDYYWQDKAVSREQYEDNIKSIYDYSKAEACIYEDTEWELDAVKTALECVSAR